MRAVSHSRARRALLAAAPLALAVTLAGCGGDDNDPLPRPSPTATATGTPSPTPSQASRNVSACLSQEVIAGSGITPANLVVPDTLRLNFAAPSGFPNGRFPIDPVIDVTLAVLLLDMTRHGPGTLAALPLNPRNDSQLLNVFPFLGAPNLPAGVAAPQPGTATTFNFRTDPVSSYRRVDRMGQPAVATAVIGTELKNSYNDADPADDATGVFVPEITARLTALHNALADDITAAGLTPCSRPG